MRILGIDYGQARTGIALTDPLNITAQGLETIHCEGSDKVILKRLDEILEQYNIDTIVVGLPYNMNGTKSERTEITEKFIHKFLQFYEFLILNLGYYLEINEIKLFDYEKVCEYSYPFSSKYSGINNYNNYNCVLGKINKKEMLSNNDNISLLYSYYLSYFFIKYIR